MTETAFSADVELGYLDNVFNATPEAEVGKRVPDGIYICRLEAVDVKRSKKEVLGFSQELEVHDGPQEGGKIFRWNNIPEEGEQRDKAIQQIGYLKHDLKMYGVDTDAQGFMLSKFLATRRNELLDVLVEVQVKTRAGQDLPNIYLNKFLGKVGEVQPEASGPVATG